MIQCANLISNGEKMKTLEFDKKFYSRRIAEFETKKFLSQEEIEEVQSMLQIITVNKGVYPKQTEAMIEIDAFNRLRKLLANNGAEEKPTFTEFTHEAPNFGVEKSLAEFMNEMYSIKPLNDINKEKKNLINEICAFTDWVNKKEGTKIYLLRDMFLSYLLQRQVNQDNTAIPFLFGRKLLKFLTNQNVSNDFDFGESDDEQIYLDFLYTLFDAADLYPNDFESFFNYLKPRFLEKLQALPDYYQFIKNELAKIKSNKILVVESGIMGTMPLILKSVDERVDFVLFGTNPAFYQLYKHRLFTKDIVKLINLEQSVCQNELFVFSSVKDGEIYIKQTTDLFRLEESKKEIANTLATYIKLQNK